MGTRGGNSEATRNHKGWHSERFAFLVVSGQSGFAACPPLRKLLKPSGEQALRPDYISFLGVLNNYIFSTINIVCNRKDRWKQEEESK